MIIKNNKVQNINYKLIKIKKFKNKFNLFFKLLFLLPNITIKSLKKLVKLIRKLSYEYRKNLLIKIYRSFNKYYKKYLRRFLKIYRTKKIKSNIITYKIKGTFLFLEIHKKNKKGLTYLKYNKYSKKQKIENFDMVSFNHNLNDFNLYQSFFMKNSKIKWDLSRLNRKKFSNLDRDKYSYRSLFIWPFIIIIKPLNIIVKNIFFKPFFIFKKWYKKIYNYKFLKKNKLYSQIHNIIVISKKNKNIGTTIIKDSSTFYWYIIQKYYFCINKKYSYNLNYKNIWFSSLINNTNLFIRQFKKYKKYYKKNYKKVNLLRKRNRDKFFLFYNFFKKYLKISFIGFSFFLRLYSLYFFWFLYFINKLFYFINKITFNYWFRFIYFTINIENNINNNLFISNKVLYKTLLNINYLNSYTVFENFITNYLINITKIIYWNYDYFINIKIKNTFYKKYFLFLYFFHYNKFFLLNIYNNYNIFFANNCQVNYLNNNNLFDNLYGNNYKIRAKYKIEYFIIIQKMYKKYPEYYLVNRKKLLKLGEDEKKNYLDMVNKRTNVLLLK